MSEQQLLNTPSKHAFSFTALVDGAWNRVRESVFQAAGAPAARLAEVAVVSVLKNIAEGELRILTLSDTYTFPATPLDEAGTGGCKDRLKAELRVLSDVFWIRLCTMGDLGFAEAYMYGEVECDDLISTFKIFLLNRERLQNLDSKLSYLFTLPQKLTSLRFLNTISNSRSNISAHYDISNKMFAGFLSEDMTYSCAIFKDLDGDLKKMKIPPILNGNGHSKINGATKTKKLHSNHAPNGIANGASNGIANGQHIDVQSTEPDELHDAQLRKIDHIIRAARIQPGQRVLEIGSGWGALALRVVAAFPGTTVDTLTLSVHQQGLAQRRIRAAGGDAAARISVHLMDYRAMPAAWAGAFDRVVSVEMVEAVGREYLEEYWRVIDWALKKGDGVGVVQGITIPEAIFPGGFIPSVTSLIQTLTAGSRGRLIVDNVSNIGPHYARTLREWRYRFLDKFDSVIVPALREEYPEVMAGARGDHEIGVFKRKWIYYYCYCEIGFTTRSLGDHIITFTREGNEAFGCTVFE